MAKKNRTILCYRSSGYFSCTFSSLLPGLGQHQVHRHPVGLEKINSAASEVDRGAAGRARDKVKAANSGRAGGAAKFAFCPSTLRQGFPILHKAFCLLVNESAVNSCYITFAQTHLLHCLSHPIWQLVLIERNNMLNLLLPGHHPVGRLLEQSVSALPASHLSLLRQASLRHGSGYNAKPL